MMMRHGVREVTKHNEHPHHQHLVLVLLHLHHPGLQHQLELVPKLLRLLQHRVRQNLPMKSSHWWTNII